MHIEYYALDYEIYARIIACLSKYDLEVDFENEEELRGTIMIFDGLQYKKHYIGVVKPWKDQK
jgi:hypothetical protein